MNSEEFLSDEELLAHIAHCVDQYYGDITLLNEAVGLLIVGRLTGWEHQRIVTPRSAWTFCTKVFGDPKKMMPRRTALAERKSRALQVVDALSSAGKLVSGYLDVVRGKITLPKEDRKTMLS